MPRSWATTTTAAPPADRSRATCITSSWWWRSSAAVGSSRSRIPVRCASTRASAALARSPPDSDGYSRAARCATSVWAMAVATASSSSSSAFVPDHGERPMRTTSPTVNGNEISIRCNSTERRMASSRWPQSSSGRSSMRTLPAVAAMSPAMAPSRVDLPAPLGPTRAISSPCRMSRSTPDRTVAPPSCTVRARTSTAIPPRSGGGGSSGWLISRQRLANRSTIRPSLRPWPACDG